MIVLSFALIVTLAIIFTATSIHGIARARRFADDHQRPVRLLARFDRDPDGLRLGVREAVHIYVNDSVGNTWSLNSNPDPTANANGGFTYSFSLPNSFIANYSVTATGPISGTATTTFTDSPNPCPSNDPTSR